MNGHAVLDVSALPTVAFKTRSTLFWAAMSVIFVEGTMFALLIATYFYVRLSMDVWPPPGISFPGVILPSIELVLLILSCIPAYLATEAAVRNDLPAIRRNLILNLLLGSSAVIIRIAVWRSFNFDWTASAYGSVVWMILGLHTTDTIAALAVTVYLIVLTLTGRMGEKQRGGVDFDSITWYFAVGIWIPLYAVVYIMPYVLQSWRL